MTVLVCGYSAGCITAKLYCNKFEIVIGNNNIAFMYTSSSHTTYINYSCDMRTYTIFFNLGWF